MFNEQSSVKTKLAHTIINSRITVRLMRMLFTLLRRFSPAFSLGSICFITRHDDVIESLQRDEELSIAPINGATTERNNGPFVLSMDRSPVHAREKALLNEVMPREDIARIQEIVERESEALINEIQAQGRAEVELVNTLTRQVPLRLLGEYFGTPGPNPTLMAHWMRSIFYDVFVNYTADPAVTHIAGQAYKELKHYLLALIVQTREQLNTTPDTVADTMLSRMIKKQTDYDWLDDDCIRRNISGVIVGAVDTTSKSVILALDELLRRPRELAGVREAALNGEREKVRLYAYEALRFNPHGPVVARYCEQALVLGADSAKPAHIKAKSRVFIALLSAMHDAQVFDEPQRFKSNRNTPYLHFGYGLHQCQGVYINAVQISALVAAVVKLKGLRRAPGSAGKIRYDGPFPDSFSVAFSH